MYEIYTDFRESGICIINEINCEVSQKKLIAFKRNIQSLTVKNRGEIVRIQ